MEAKRIYDNIDNDFMNWLSQYLDINSEVSSNDECSAQDKKNIKLLTALYDLLDEYAKNQGINPIVDGEGSHYLLHYNDNLYDVGYEINRNSGIYAFSSYDNIPSAIISWEDMQKLERSKK
ncbi:MAG TPA: hypothetical protein PLT65_04085 [Bacilli bacterium]|nr:hypothetical protein [Bacilli bacterium]